jgi:hypothetical protein
MEDALLLCLALMARALLRNKRTWLFASDTTK